jgi:Xaa-Pro aminopeptidase
MRSKARVVTAVLGWLAVAAGSALVAAPLAVPLAGGEARARWERLCQIRKDKLDRVLPEAMRQNGIDMWVVTLSEGNYDPLYDDLGRGYPGSRLGYYVFTDRGVERIERAALGIDGGKLEACGTYDIVEGGNDLKAFVAARDPKRIGVNISEEMGAADGLSHANYLRIVRELGEPWASRLVSAEKLVSDFRSRRVASEIAAFAEAGELSRRIAEAALSNDVITPGVTTLADVAWWMEDRLLERGLGSSFDLPSVYVTGPKGIEDVSNDRIIRAGDFLAIDWGVCHLNLCTDVKRIAYVLKPGEARLPAGLQKAFDQAVQVRDILRREIKAGRTAQETLDLLNAKIAEAGFHVMPEFNKTSDTPKTEVIIGCHSVGNTGHGIGPSIAWFNPKRLGFEIRPTNLLSIELFAWTPAPEWGGAKIRIPLEDDAIVTERGVEWLYPINPGIRLIR